MRMNCLNCGHDPDIHDLGSGDEPCKVCDDCPGFDDGRGQMREEDKRTDGATGIQIPDGITPLVGYRGWTHRDGHLFGAHQQEPWPPGEITAEAICTMRRPKAEIILHNIPTAHFTDAERKITELVEAWAEDWSDPHEPPNEDCSCGLYAKLRKADVSDGAVHGRISAWGKIVKGAHGFRAQFARVSGLYLAGGFFEPIETPERIEMVSRIAENYGVEILDLPPSHRPVPVHDLRPELEEPEKPHPVLGTRDPNMRKILEDLDRKLFGGN